MAGQIISGLVSKAGGPGNIAQAGFAAGQMIAGAINRKKADAMLPPTESVMERQLFNTARRRRIALQTGTAATGDRASLKQMVKQFGQNSFRAGGPVNTGIFSQLFTQGQKNISDQYGQQVAQAAEAETALGTKMADVGRDLALLKSARKSAQAEQQVQAGSQNLLATLGAGKLSKENEMLKKKLGSSQNQEG